MAQNSGSPTVVAGLILGASSRAGIGLSRASQSLALVEGRTFVIPDDVKKLAVPVLGHRLVSAGMTSQGADAAEDVLREILDSLPVPA